MALRWRKRKIVNALDVLNKKNFLFYRLKIFNILLHILFIIFTAATLPKSSSFSRSGPGSQLNTKLQKAQSFDVAR